MTAIKASQRSIWLPLSMQYQDTASMTKIVKPKMFLGSYDNLSGSQFQEVF